MDHSNPAAEPSGDARIHPHWAGIVPPSLYRSHPILIDKRRIRISRPDAATSLPTPPSSAPLTPPEASDNGIVWGTSTNDFFASQGSSPVKSGGSSRSSSREPPVTSVTTPSKSGPVALDRFAASYLPLWLREESMPAPVHYASLPDRRMYPDEDYTASVYPSAHVPSTEYLDACGDSLLCHPPSPSRVLPLPTGDAPLPTGYYTAHFTALLSMWLDAEFKRMKAATIPLVPLVFTPAANKAYRIIIPGIREDAPKLAIGDRMVLRGMIVSHQVPSPIAVEAEVVGLNKLAGWVYVKSPHLDLAVYQLPRAADGLPRFQVRFMLSVDPFCAMQDAVRRVGFAADHGHLVARRWLMPERQDVHDGPGGGAMIREWYDTSLNSEQRMAVEQIVHRTHTIPYLISGPPGTGKTKTIVEAVYQILAHDPEATILLCAPSNPAADTLVRRLTSTMKVGSMLRLNSPTRTFAEVPEAVLPYCHIAHDTFGLPAFAELMKYRVVVTSCQDAGMLVNGQATNGELMRAQRTLFRSLYPNTSRCAPPIHPHWTHLLVDEAAQASEPELLIPLEVVLPWTDYQTRGRDGTRDPAVILCGDVHQLGPVITSREARDGELDVSLLERLFRREVYQKVPIAQTQPMGLSNGQSISSAPSSCCTHLVQNYRSIAPILMVPAALFYNDTLIASAADVNLLQWSGLPNPRIPILFQGCDSEESWIDEGASWYNDGEIREIVRIIQDLRSERPEIKQSEIAVITPWKEQVWRLRAKLRSVSLHGVDVGHVEAYQGAEFRVTILSCVRSRSRFLDTDRQANMGLFNEPKRFNVAITRAKELLVVVGNANLLKADPFWNGFLQVMLRNGLYKGPKVEMEMTGAYISRIESQMRRHDDLDCDEAALMLAGEMARDILRET